MLDLWAGLPVLVQDIALLLGMLAPVALLGVVVLRGYDPWPLIAAILWRFRVATVLFVGLVALSVGIGVGLIAQERALRAGTAAAADKFDMIVAAPGSEMTMLLAAVFLQPSDVPLLDGATYTEVASARAVEMAAPLAFGDSADGAPVVGTIADFVTHLSDGRVEGRLWQDTFEAVAGADAPFAIGDDVTPSHGVGDAVEGTHDGIGYRVVGRMPRTGTPWDDALLVPVEAVWSTHGLADGHAEAGRLGPPFDAAFFPGTPAIVVRAETLAANYGLRAQFQGTGDTMAFFPGAVLSQLYGVLGDVRQAMSLLSLVTQGLVSVAVLLSLFLLTRLMGRQLALLRALGAPARFVFAVVWGHATLCLVAGALLGLAIGLGAATVLSDVLAARTEIDLIARIGWTEIHAVAGFVALASVAALIPAATALRQDIVAGLRG